MATNISTLTIKASIQKVWNTLTLPELVKKWQYGSDMTTDWKPGNAIRFRTEWDGKVFEQWGTVLELVENKLIRYSLFAPRPDLEDKPENYFEMKYILTPENENVKLQIIQEDNRPGAKQEKVQGEENPVLKGLKSLIES